MGRTLGRRSEITPSTLSLVVRGLFFSEDDSIQVTAIHRYDSRFSIRNAETSRVA